MLCAFNPGFTTTTSGVVQAPDTGAKLFTGSKPSFW
jgi:hypothetical protein